MSSLLNKDGPLISRVPVMENKVFTRVQVNGLVCDTHSQPINVFVFAPTALQRWTRGTMPTQTVFAVGFVLVLFNYVAWLWKYSCQTPIVLRLP